MSIPSIIFNDIEEKRSREIPKRSFDRQFRMRRRSFQKNTITQDHNEFRSTAPVQKITIELSDDESEEKEEETKTFKVCAPKLPDNTETRHRNRRPMPKRSITPPTPVIEDELKEKLHTIIEERPQTTESYVTPIVAQEVPVIEEPKTVSYILTRTKTHSFKGTRIHYQFAVNSKPMYHSKVKAYDRPHEIYIDEGNIAHFSGTVHAGVMTVSENGCNYSMHLDTKDGPDLGNIMFFKPDGFRGLLKSTIKLEDKNLPEQLNSRLPVKKEDGSYSLVGFGNRCVIPSSKNMIFTDDNDKEYVAVMKPANNTLMIDASSEVSSLVAFMIGLASLTVSRSVF